MPQSHSGEPSQSKGTYAFVSLGCPKNLVDSEKMLGSLSLDGVQSVRQARAALGLACAFAAIDALIAKASQRKTRGNKVK